MKNILLIIGRGLLGVAGLVGLIVSVQLLVWSIERSPPTRFVEYYVAPVKPGKSTTVYETVERDKNRPCSATYTRLLFDSTGTRFDLTGGEQHTNAAARERIALLTPGRLNYAVKVPQEAAAGKATVITTMNYVCNPVHEIFPIESVINVTLEIL